MNKCIYAIIHLNVYFVSCRLQTSANTLEKEKLNEKIFFYKINNLTIALR